MLYLVIRVMTILFAVELGRFEQVLAERPGLSLAHRRILRDSFIPMLPRKYLTALKHSVLTRNVACGRQSI